MNLFIASGNLGADVELRYLSNGDAVASFSLAVNDRWTTPSGEKKEATVWARVTVWRALAENCAKFIHKRSKVIVKGKLMPINLFTKKDGSPGASYEVTADTVDFLDSAPQDEGQPSAPPATQQKATARTPERVEADLPF